MRSTSSGAVGATLVALAALALPLALPAASASAATASGDQLAAARAAAGSHIGDPVAAARAVQASLAGLDRRISDAVETYDQARIAADTARRTASGAARQAATARRTYLADKAQLAALAVAARPSGPASSSLSAVADSGGPTGYLERLSLLSAVSRGQSDLVSAVAAAKDRYQASAATASAAARQAAATLSRAQATRDSIRHRIAAQRALLAQLRARAAALAAAAARDAAARAASREVGHTLSTFRTGGGTTATGHHSYRAPSVSGAAGAAVAAAYSALGRPYVYGAGGPGSFDCSGLTMWSWAHAGVSLPHSSSAQYASLPHVSRSDLQPGDLLFFYSPISHVGIYVGGGRMIDAPHTGAVVTLRTPLWSEFAGAARP